ncbi:MAG: glycosyltransferase [Cyanobacteriota bacterium ELA615]
MRICQVIASINHDFGGPPYSVTQLAEYLFWEGIDSHLFTLDYPNRGIQLTTNNVKIHSYLADKPSQYFYGFHPFANSSLQQIASSELDIIHNHGLWLFPNLYARQAAFNNNLPLLTSPRGMLESWSLSNSWFKKLPAWLLYEHKNLSQASVLHATSEEELKSIRKLNFRQPVALIPNGILLPDLSKLPPREILENTFPELKSKKWLLFLSRIHPKKGVDNLIFLWRELKEYFPDWHLILAGSDLNNFQRKLEKMITQLGLQQNITFTGMLSGDYKAAALANAELFILPSHSENFGIAIAEALSYQVPVITTKKTPWQDLANYECGWWVEDNLPALKEAMVSALELSDSERKLMGSKGRILVKNKYSWQEIAKDMSKVYYWMLSGGIPPDCLVFK